MLKVREVTVPVVIFQPPMEIRFEMTRASKLLVTATIP